MNTSVKFTVLSALAFSLAAQATFAQTPSTTSTSETKTSQKTKSSNKVKSASDKNSIGSADKRFLGDVAKINLTEIKLGEVAQSKATDEQVKSFGQKMISDHQQVQEQLKALADSKNVSLPKDLDSTTKSTITRLSKLSGAHFDRAYVNEMVSAHKKAANLLKSAQKRESTPSEIKDFAKNTLSGVDEHLKMAAALDATLTAKKAVPVAERKTTDKKQETKTH